MNAATKHEKHLVCCHQGTKLPSTCICEIQALQCMHSQYMLLFNALRNKCTDARSTRATAHTRRQDTGMRQNQQSYQNSLLPAHYVYRAGRADAVQYTVCTL